MLAHSFAVHAGMTPFNANLHSGLGMRRTVGLCPIAVPQTVQTFLIPQQRL